ncbi:MAG TPA: Nudix family hydrolase [Gammaproteobacteria bacterium]|nr:Nudix family hydrolase [Gammaproteobacteria bacterium]
MSGTATTAVIPVAVAVLTDVAGRVLITQRPADKSMAGRWEFPGGKLHVGETVEEALRRELHEELGIDAGGIEPLITVRHEYPDRCVLLEVRRVTDWRGEPHPREGQAFAWVLPGELRGWDLLEADVPIVTALRLPDHCLVTPDPGPDGDRETFLHHLDARLADGVRLVQLRAPSLSVVSYARLARDVRAICQRHGALLLLNAEPALVEETGADGVHLNARRLLALRSRPLGRERWVAASCHDERELAKAQELEVDFVLIGSVRPTPSHATGAVLGWDGFARLARQANRPAYAIGGLTIADISLAKAAGGQGIAAIRGLWQPV